MAIPPADPNQYFTPTFDKDMPQGTATHFRQLYLATQQHDQALKILHASMNTTTTVVRTVSAGGSSGTVIIPGNTPVIASQWLNSYDSSTGVFGQSQPAYSDITGTPTLAVTKTPVAGEYLTGYDSTTGAFSQSTPAGISVVIVTAALTLGGTQGSMTFVGGLLTASTPAT